MAKKNKGAGARPRNRKRGVVSGVEVDNGADIGATAEALADIYKDESITTAEFNRNEQLRMLHKLLLNRVAPSAVCKAMGISTAAYYNLRSELNEKLRMEAESLDIPTYSGRTIAFYEEVKAQAMALSRQVKNEYAKVSALRLSMEAENNKHRFLSMAGFFDFTKLSPQASVDEKDTGANTLIELSKAFLNGETKYVLDDGLKKPDRAENVTDFC